MSGKWRHIWNRLRISNPWRYKAPLLMAVPYHMMLVNGLAPLEALWGLLASATTILGIAGLGYFSNDFADREEDAAAGKANLFLEKSMGFMVLIGMVLLVLALLPWVLYFPLTPFSYGLLGAEFGLFALYSLPPFRFKERGILGVACDALYAHGVPAVLAAWTFFLIGGEHYSKMEGWLWMLFAWQAALGLRNIVLHQMGDAEKDLGTGTRTWVTQIGKPAARQIMRYGLVPLETGLFSLVLVWWSFRMPLMPLAYVGFAVLTWIWRTRIWKNGLPDRLEGRLSLWLDEFYVEWIPVVMLLGLVRQDPGYAGLLALHVVLFRNAIWSQARAIWGQFPRLKAWLS